MNAMNAIVQQADGYEGIVMQSKRNPDSAAIMLRYETQTVNDEGFLQKETRVGLFKGDTKSLTALVTASGLQAGDNFSQKVFPIRLVIRESITPEYPEQEPKINPSTGEVVTSGGNPVYRSTKVVAANSPLEDQKLEIDRTPVTESATAAPNTEFAKAK